MWSMVFPEDVTDESGVGRMPDISNPNYALPDENGPDPEGCRAWS